MFCRNGFPKVENDKCFWLYLCYSTENENYFDVDCDEHLEALFACPCKFLVISREDFRDFGYKQLDIYKGIIEIMPIPTIEEFNSHLWGEEFCAILISQKDFEELWNTHIYNRILDTDILNFIYSS